MLKNAQSTLIQGADKPFPGGAAKGVGKGLPEMPFTKCGIAFAKNMPEKNAAI